MHNHFDKNLNVKNLILKRKPVEVIEMGASYGENTSQLCALSQKTGYPATVITISDTEMPEHLQPFVATRTLLWINGISYKVLKTWFDTGQHTPLSFVSIDTDHNYWTLDQEMSLVEQMSDENTIVVVHDTLYLMHANSMERYYKNGADYPKAEILSQQKAYYDRVREGINTGKWKIIDTSYYAHGATALQRTPEKEGKEGEKI